MQHIYVVRRAKLELNSQRKHHVSPQKHKHHDHAMQTACLLNFSDDSPLPEGLHRHAPGSAVLSPPFLFTAFSFDHRTP